MAKNAKNVFEIRFHARSGQGAKTAAQFVAEAALDSGKEFQAFSEYGAERTGAPMRTFARISSEKIRTHEPVVNPDVVVVLDQSLIESVNVADGLGKGGILLINSKKNPKEFEKIVKTLAKIHTIDATGISVQLLGKDFPNMPLLGALVKLTNIVPLSALKSSIVKKYHKKLGEEKTNANIEAINRGFKEVK